MKKKLNKRGISLIVLVITIIIMIILAAAIILSLNSSGIIEKANKAKTDSDIASKKQAATVALAEYDLLVNSNDTSVQGKTAEQYVREKLQAQGIDASDVTITDNREILVGSQWSLPIGDTQVNVGDLLTPTLARLGNEKFYVIADDATTLTLLAERNVDTSANAQAADINPVKFDDSSNIYYNSTHESFIKGLVDAYVERLINEGLILEDVELVYNGSVVTGEKGRLMWYEETKDTTLKAVPNYSDIIYGPSSARMKYWLGSSDVYGPGPGDPGVWCIREGSESLSGAYYMDNFYGMRPVIKILKALV